MGGGLREVDDRRRPTVCKCTVGKYGAKRRGPVFVVLTMKKDLSMLGSVFGGSL